MADPTVKETLAQWSASLDSIHAVVDQAMKAVHADPITRLQRTLASDGLSTALPTTCCECGRYLDSNEIRMSDYYGSSCVDCHRTYAFDHIVNAKDSHSRWPWQKRAWRKRTFPAIPAHAGRPYCNVPLQPASAEGSGSIPVQR